MEWNRISFNNIGYNLYKLIGIGTKLVLFLLKLGFLTNIFFGFVKLSLKIFILGDR